MEKIEENLDATATAYAMDIPIDAMKSLRLGSDSRESDTNAVQLHEQSTMDDCFSDRNPYDALALLEEEEKEKEANADLLRKEEKEKIPHRVESFRLRELSRKNGQINRMRIDQLKKRLKQLNLDAGGAKGVLQKRLKSYYRREDLKEPDYHYKYYVVIDFEATCDVQPNHFRHEIIEFPAVLVSTKKRKIIAKFHSYVRPTINPKLTTFCTNLTGITQDQVNFAPEFPEVLQKFDEWLKEKKLISDMKTFAVVTDGPWDMGRFLFYQCKISKVTYPNWAKTWINIKKPFCNFYNTERMNLQKMLSELGLSFIGQPHSGLDDAHNIARVAIKLYEDGANMRVNEQISFQKPRKRDQRMFTVKSISRSNFNAMIKRKNVDPPKDNETTGSNSEDDDVDDSPEDSTSDSKAVPDWENGPYLDNKYEEEFPSLISKPL